MRHLILMALLYFGAVSVARADECTSWTHRAYPVTLEACSYDDGGSGYYRITNDGSQDANVCWDVVSNDGSHDEGCNLHLAAGESTRGSCFQCGTNNDGVQYILLTKYETD